MQQIRIDFDNPGLPQSLGAVEGESQSRIFQAALYKSGAAYTAPAGAVYSIMYRGFGPQNQGWYDTIEDGAGKRAACTVSGNVVTCELARQALRVPGHLTVVLCVSDAKGYMLKSWPIMADVRNDGYEDTGESEMYFNLSGIAGNYLTQLEKAMTDADTTRNNLISTSAQAKKDIDAKAAETLKTIPESYTELDGSVKQLKEDIGIYKSIYSGSKYFKRIDESIQWNQNKYWNTETNQQMDGDGFVYGKLQCNAGDIFQVTSTGTKISNAVAFIDESGNILQKSNETTNTAYTSKQFEAPAFTKFAIFDGVPAIDNRVPLILMSYEIDFVPEFANEISKNSGMIENISRMMEWNIISLKKVTNSYFEGWNRGFITGTPGFEYTLIQAKAGDKFKYSGVCGEKFRAAFFRDENGAILGSTPETKDTTYVDLIITAPYGTFDIVFNAQSASNMQISKLETPKNFKEIALKKSQKLFMEDKYVDYQDIGFESAEVDAKQGDTFIYVNGYSDPSWRAVYFVDEDYNVLDKSTETDSSVRKNIIMTAPYGTAKAIFNNNLETQNELIVREKISSIDNKSFWKDKKIVWFGTSIPAGTQEWNYPYKVGELQGSIVYNEAVGSSCARAGCKSKITDNDPYGWTGANFYNVAYGLSGTLSEKNELISNFSKWKTLLEGCPETLSDSEKQKILSCSYENKLDKYLSDGSVGTMDLYVFDHGYNDNWFYNSTINQMDVIPDNNMDRFYYIGAMNFLINRILEDNPKAVICFIGHYEADRKETSIVTKAQQVLADYWRFPFIKTWKYLPFTERTVQANGYWQMSSGIGTWVEDDKQHLMTMREVWLADGLHPYSDGSGKATLKYANLLANFLNENVS